MLLPFGHGRVAAALSCALFSGLLFAPQKAHALSFIFTPQAGTSQQAIDGFKAAGNLWSSRFTDSVTVNISIGFAALGGSILAQASSMQTVFSYTDVRTALTADATSLLDATAISSLQAGPFLQFVTNDATGAVVLDNNNTANNQFLAVNSANAKALGLTAANATASDASISFNSSFNYDFDRTDGVITSGTFDFVGLAAHEIGHALGFVSGVDDVDYYSGPRTGPQGVLDLNPYAVFSTLDLFRYSSASITQVAGFGTVEDLSQGAASYFSVDKGATNMGLFSTGPYDGDGSQASHWKDNRGLGIMDPTAAPGELLAITGNDLNAFDAIGWNLETAQAPEPSALSLMCGVFILLGGIRVARRRKRTA